MLVRLIVYLPLLLGAGSSFADEPAGSADQEISGMSIVGNDEAPKSLVIVPWKSSELGNGTQVSRVLDDGRGPVDKDVFMRQLGYYEIRSEGRP